jgi:hypothetical protein
VKRVVKQAYLTCHGCQGFNVGGIAGGPDGKLWCSMNKLLVPRQHWQLPRVLFARSVGNCRLCLTDRFICNLVLGTCRFLVGTARDPFLLAATHHLLATELEEEAQVGQDATVL